MTKMTTYERIAYKLLKDQPKAKPFGKLVGNQFLIGHKSLHWTTQARTWRLFWRLKQNRISKTLH